MTKILQLISAEQSQYIAYFVLSLAVTLGTALVYSRDELIYKPFIGDLNPVLTVIAISILGGVLLTYLLARGWFAVFAVQNLPGWAVAAGLGVVLALVMIFIDSRVILPPDINRPYPNALLFYPTIGFVVEIVFHVLPLTVLLFLLTTLFKSAAFETIVWPCLLLVALLEPIFQTWFGFSRPYPAWVLAIIAFIIFLINLAQLFLFKRYDFMTMYVLRLVYYLLWHIVWGVLRLRLLF